jgi:hypothetical protein
MATQMIDGLHQARLTPSEGVSRQQAGRVEADEWLTTIGAQLDHPTLTIKLGLVVFVVGHDRAVRGASHHIGAVRQGSLLATTGEITTTIPRKDSLERCLSTRSDAVNLAHIVRKRPPPGCLEFT